MRLVKKILKIVGIVLLPFVLVIVGYLSYVLIQYHRIEDALPIEAENKQETIINKDATFKIATYNIGFGAYSQDYSFFMDSGTMKDGTPVQGVYAKAFSKEVVETNTNGAINVLKGFDLDFAFLQEVDTQSTRSYKINQYKCVQEAFPNYESIFASNFHTSYLLYPFNDPIGKSNSGIVMLSKYKTDSSIRYSFPLTGKILSDLFDLDRCFMVTRIKISEEKDLVLVALHMSAYDEGGKVRAEQMKLLCDFLDKEKGNYVIVGGDFNHNLNEHEFPTDQLKPDWVAEFPKAELTSGYAVVSGENCPTCRSTDMPYTKNVNYTVVIDGFIVSSNIQVVSIENYDTDFMYSDHNPAVMTFRLV